MVAGTVLLAIWTLGLVWLVGRASGSIDRHIRAHPWHDWEDDDAQDDGGE